MAKVVVTDYTFESLDVEKGVLEPCGCEVVGEQCRTPEEVIRLVADADYVITQFAPVTAEVIGAMEKARIIVRYGIGVDNVDLEKARSKGIPVCNVPDYCIDEVADHTLAFILAATRSVLENDARVRAGEWGLAVPLNRMRTLRDLTVGVIGFGRIGREVAARLAPFKPRILVHDPCVSEQDIREIGFEPASMDQALSESDVLTLHCPSTPETAGMINRETLGKMRPGSILVNLARGNLVETGSLIEALESGRISAAALDVFDPEPPPGDSPLRSMKQTVLASHVASASVPAVRRLRETAAHIVRCAVEGGPLPNIVNGVRG